MSFKCILGRLCYAWWFVPHHLWEYNWICKCIQLGESEIETTAAHKAGKRVSETEEHVERGESMAKRWKGKWETTLDRYEYICSAIYAVNCKWMHHIKTRYSHFSCIVLRHDSEMLCMNYERFQTQTHTQWAPIRGNVGIYINLNFLHLALSSSLYISVICFSHCVARIASNMLRAQRPDVWCFGCCCYCISFTRMDLWFLFGIWIQLERLIIWKLKKMTRMSLFHSNYGLVETLPKMDFTVLDFLRILNFTNLKMNVIFMAKKEKNELKVSRIPRKNKNIQEFRKRS